MNEEKQKILKKIDELITKRKSEMLKQLPSIHEIDDGIIIRFFTEWDNCKEDSAIKYKKIKNRSNPDESVVFFYIPKGSYFDLKQRFYIGCITCINGIIDITTNNITERLEAFNKICVETDEVQGLALENTYIITTSNKLVWSKKTREHVMEHQL